MILSELVWVSPTNSIRWYRDRGYSAVERGSPIVVSIHDLPKDSNLNLKFRCDSCGTPGYRTWMRLRPIGRKHYCDPCGKEHSRKITIARNKTRTGENSPIWSGNHGVYHLYRRKVDRLTREQYKLHKATINPNNYPRGKAGIQGAYHLDHIVSVAEGFDRDIAPELIADYTNLRMLPWKDNVGRQYRKYDLERYAHRSIMWRARLQEQAAQRVLARSVNSSEYTGTPAKEAAHHV